MIGRCQGYPSNPTALINMLVTSTPDGPETHAYSTTCNTVNTTSTDTTPTSANDKVNEPSTLTADQKDTFKPMQMIDPFCKCIFKRLLSEKALSHEVNTFTQIKGLIYKHVMDTNKRFLALVTPNLWHFTVLIEAHDKLGHQEVNSFNHLVKHQYYLKGMNKNIHKYINNCALCQRKFKNTGISPLDD